MSSSSAKNTVTRIVSTGDLLAAVREEIQREIRLAGLTSEPAPTLSPPADVGAEREVISAVLCDHVRPDELGDLEPGHFFLPLHQWIFGKARSVYDAGLKLTMDLLIAAAIDDGVSADGFARELDDLRFEAFRTHTTLLRHVARIIELWRRRELCTLIAAVDVRLRTGALDYERAIKLLSRGIER